MHLLRFCCRVQVFWIAKVRAKLSTSLPSRRGIRTSTTIFISMANVGVCLMFLDNRACSWTSSVHALMHELTIHDFVSFTSYLYLLATIASHWFHLDLVPPQVVS